MHPGPHISSEAAPSLGWARRLLRQHLAILARLAEAACRLANPTPQPPKAFSAATISAGVRGLEQALRLQVRVAWALRLIDALRAKLVADLQALDSGRLPDPPLNPPGEARSFAPEPEHAAADAASRFTDKIERAERPERPERLERERFGFESRGSDAELAEILKRPTEEVIALICRELGLPADWLRLAEQAWAREAGDDDWTEPPGSPGPGSPPGPPRRLAAPS